MPTNIGTMSLAKLTLDVGPLAEADRRHDHDQHRCQHQCGRPRFHTEHALAFHAFPSPLSYKEIAAQMAARRRRIC